MNFIDLLRRAPCCLGDPLSDPYQQPFGDVVNVPRGRVEKQINSQKNGGLNDSRRNTCRISVRNQSDSSR